MGCLEPIGLGGFQRWAALANTPVSQICLLNPDEELVKPDHVLPMRRTGMPEALVEIATLVRLAVTVDGEMRGNVAAALARETLGGVATGSIV